MVHRRGHQGLGLGRIAAAIVVVLLCACNPAPSSPSAFPASPASPAPTTTAPTPLESATPTGAGALEYVALGDSLASGIGGHPSYADEYRRLLRRHTGRPVRLTNLGRPGWTSAQLLNALQTDDRFRTAVSGADVVTWDIGGNDILLAAFRALAGGCDRRVIRCLRAAREEFTDNWVGILDELAALRESRDVRLQTFDLYTPFVTLPGVPREEALAELARMNATIRASERRAGTAVAPVEEAFRRPSGEPLIAADGVHPTAAGHRLIARLLAAQLR